MFIVIAGGFGIGVVGVNLGIPIPYIFLASMAWGAGISWLQS